MESIRQVFPTCEERPLSFMQLQLIEQRLGIPGKIFKTLNLPPEIAEFTQKQIEIAVRATKDVVVFVTTGNVRVARLDEEMVRIFRSSASPA